jgi:diadenosine tetraphosphatase ApaH/serine/threonine PP2A family protein phosphatase
VHGGLSPGVVLVSDVNAIRSHTEIPDKGPLADLTWSDPKEQPGLEFHDNPRGAGKIFGKEVVKKFNHLNRLRVITR